MNIFSPTIRRSGGDPVTEPGNRAHSGPTVLTVWARGRTSVPSVTRVVKRAAVSSGCVSVARRLGSPARWANILRYHSASGPADYRSPTIAVAPDLFDAQVAYIARNYTVLTLDRLKDCLAADDLPRNAVAITFDDGYMDNFKNALPALRRHNLTATFFVTAGPVLGQGAFWVGWLSRAAATAGETVRDNAGGWAGLKRPAAAADVFAALARRVDAASGDRRAEIFDTLERLFPHMPPLSAPSDFMMHPAELEHLLEAKMTVGAHTVTHRVLAGAPRTEALDELVGSRRSLEAALGTRIDHLAYPNGHVKANVDCQSIELAAEAGFATAGTSRRGVATPAANLLDLPRQGINNALGFHGFAFKLEEARFPFVGKRRG